MKILLVHWDPKKGRGLRQALQRMGHAVLLATDDESLQKMLKRRPDLILLSPELVEIDGRRLFDHEARGPLPLLMAIPTPSKQESPPPTAEEEELATVFTQADLRLASHIMRRLRKLIRKETARVRVGKLVIHFEEKQAWFCQQPLRLTPLQFTLLGTLALNVDRVLGPGELLESVWGYEANDTEARELLKVHIRRLRQKMYAISPDGANYIQSVRGFGYRLSSPEPI